MHPGHREHHSVDLIGGEILPGVVRFTLPLMAAGLLQMAFNAADVVVVGRFVGDNALAAVTSTTSLVALLVNAMNGLSTGANVVTAQLFGAGDRQGVSRSAHTSILLALLCGLTIAVVGLVLSPALLRWMSSPESIIGQSILYLRIYFLGIPAAMLYNFGSALLRTSGDTRRPTGYLIFAGALNVVLNLFFVVTFRMAVAGVALATTLSNWVSGGLVLRALLLEQGPLHLDPRRLRLDGAIVRRVVKIGLPAGISSIIIALSNVVVQSSVNSLGEAVMAGSGASNNIESLLDTVNSAFYQTCIAYTGANLGAKKVERIDAARRSCVLLCTGTLIVTGGLCYLFGRQLLGIYISSPAAISAGLARLSMTGSMYFLVGICDIWSSNLRGMGRSVGPSVCYIVVLCGLRFVWVATVFRYWHTPISLFLVFPVTRLAAGAAIGTLLFLTRRKVYAQVRAELAAQPQAE